MHSLELFLWVRCLVSAGFALARVVIEIFAPNNDCKNAGWMLRIALKFFWYSHRRIIEPSFVLPLYFMWRDLSLTALTTISLRERQTLNYRLTLIIFFKLRSRLASLLQFYVYERNLRAWDTSPRGAHNLNFPLLLDLVTIFLSLLDHRRLFLGKRRCKCNARHRLAFAHS